MNPNRALWEKGDFTKIAATMRESGEELVESLGVSPDSRFSISVAAMAQQLFRKRSEELTFWRQHRGNLVAAGNAGAAAVELDNLQFPECDVSDLQDLADKSFDLKAHGPPCKGADVPLDAWYARLHTGKSPAGTACSGLFSFDVIVPS